MIWLHVCWSLQAYLSPKNLMACHVQMANIRTASLWCHGKRANPLLGTQLSSAGVCTVADSYVSGSAREAGTAAKTATQRKEAKYATLQGTLFQPVVVELMGTAEEATSSFLAELGHRITALSGDSPRLVFCFNAFLFLCSDLTPFCCGIVLLQTASCPDDDLQSYTSCLIFSSLGNCYRGFKKNNNNKYNE